MDHFGYLDLNLKLILLVGQYVNNLIFQILLMMIFYVLFEHKNAKPHIKYFIRFELIWSKNSNYFVNVSESWRINFHYCTSIETLAHCIM